MPYGIPIKSPLGPQVPGNCQPLRHFHQDGRNPNDPSTETTASRNVVAYIFINFRQTQSSTLNTKPSQRLTLCPLCCLCVLCEKMSLWLTFFLRVALENSHHVQPFCGYCVNLHVQMVNHVLSNSYERNESPPGPLRLWCL